jgi:protein subunit release factor A
VDVRLRQALARAEEVARELADPATAGDTARLTALLREHARIQPIVRAAESLQRTTEELAGARELAADHDAEMAAMAAADIRKARQPPISSSVCRRPARNISRSRGSSPQSGGPPALCSPARSKASSASWR